MYKIVFSLSDFSTVPLYCAQEHILSTIEMIRNNIKTGNTIEASDPPIFGGSEVIIINPAHIVKVAIFRA